MADLEVTFQDLAVFMGADIDVERGTFLLGMAVQACSTIVTVTDSAKFVVLGVAARVYANPVPQGSQTAGPFNQGGAIGGISLTRAEERQLRRLAGGGGAFSIDPLPANAGCGLPWWDGFVATEDDS